MRWDGLFGDMEAQLAAARQQDLETEISERVRLELAGISLADRLRAAAGSQLHITVRGQLQFFGTVSCVGLDWLLLSVSTRSVLLPLGALVRVSGLGPQAVEPVGRVGISLASALRNLMRDRAGVVLYLADDGSPDAGLTGVLDGVGQDFVEFSVLPAMEPARSHKVTARYVVPFSMLLAVASQAEDRP
ncbi:hypothetical protein IV498_06180 [Paenarthrobacter sp. Z7-10]|nr:hypothetical protein [Paenarthrobacter sp. Z7-10]